MITVGYLSTADSHHWISIYMIQWWVTEDKLCLVQLIPRKILWVTLTWWYFSFLLLPPPPPRSSKSPPSPQSPQSPLSGSRFNLADLSRTIGLVVCKIMVQIMLLCLRICQNSCPNFRNFLDTLRMFWQRSSSRLQFRCTKTRWHFCGTFVVSKYDDSCWWCCLHLSV